MVRTKPDKRKAVRQCRIRYPWNKWFNGVPHAMLLQKGKHFKCAPYAMAQQIRNKGYERGQRVSIQIEGTKLQVFIGGSTS